MQHANLGRYRGQWLKVKKVEQRNLKSTKTSSPTSHFARAGPGMGCTDLFPHTGPGNLPRLHICQSWAAPPLEEKSEGGGRWTSEHFPHTPMLPQQTPGLPSPGPPPPKPSGPGPSAWIVGCSEIAPQPLCQFVCLTLYLTQLIGSQRVRASPWRQEELTHISQDEGFRKRSSSFKRCLLHFLQ